MATNRKETEEIDESFLLASIKGRGTKKEPVMPEPQQEQMPKSMENKQEKGDAEPTVISQESFKEAGRPKQEKRREYETLFLKESDVTARLGKTVYIRKEFHERITKILHVIGDNEVSMFSYIDNVLAYHFESFQDEIVRSYKQKNNNNLF